MRVRTQLLALAAAAAVPVAAQAHDHGPPPAAVDAAGRVYDAAMPPQPDERLAQWEADRAAWLDECRARMDRQDDWYDGYDRGWRRKRSSGVTGAVLGGVAGGLIGRGIAGRDDKTLGTVAGAVVGAAAGAAIERASSSREVRAEGRGYSGDYCEQYFNYYTQGGWGGGWGHHGMAWGGMMMVPVMQMQGIEQRKPCVETVTTTEYVTVSEPIRRVRTIRVPDKRVRIVPDKRLPVK